MKEHDDQNSHLSKGVDMESYSPRCMVAMPFKQEWSKVVFSAIENVMRSIKVNVFKVDMTKRTSLKLAIDVENQIKNADIIIADLTTQNSNVQLEVGFAIANDKDILLCTQSKDDVCAHLKDYLFIEYKPDKNGLDELSRQLRLRIQECLERAKSNEEKRKLKLQLSPTYSVKCFKDRDVATLADVFLSAHHRIDILTTNLSWLFLKEGGSDRSYWEAIGLTVKRNELMQLRILTLNPESEIAANRGHQLGFTPVNFRDQLRRGYEKAKTFASSYPTSRVEIRIYDELPTQITFRIDNEVFTCIVGQPMQSRNYPVLKFDVANLGVQEAFLSHFLNVWKDAI